MRGSAANSTVGFRYNQTCKVGDKKRDKRYSNKRLHLSLGYKTPNTVY